MYNLLPCRQISIQSQQNNDTNTLMKAVNIFIVNFEQLVT